MTTTTGTIRGSQHTATVLADSDLVGKEGYAVAFDATDERIVNIQADGTLPSFVLAGGGEVAGSGAAPEEVAIVTGGEAIVKLGGSVGQGDYLMPTTAGVWIVATDGNFYGCQALADGISGDEIRVRVQSGYLETT